MVHGVFSVFQPFILQLHKNSLKEFTRGLFAQVREQSPLVLGLLLSLLQCELLAPYVHNVDAIYATFLKYFPSRISVPVLHAHVFVLVIS